MDQALVPAATLAISIMTFAFTQWRTQKIDDRAAAKDTVDLLATQNDALSREVADLRVHMAECERARLELMERLARQGNQP